MPETRPSLPTDRLSLARMTRDINTGVHALDAETQNHIEVLTGKRLQQRDIPPGTEPEPVPGTPVLTSLDPATAVLGSPTFDIHVHGEGFKPGSVIVFAGHEEPTTFVSDTELTTGVDMSVWLGPDPAIPVEVFNAPDGEISNTLMFSFTAAQSQAASANKGEKAPSAVKIPPPQTKPTTHPAP